MLEVTYKTTQIIHCEQYCSFKKNFILIHTEFIYPLQKSNVTRTE